MLRVLGSRPGPAWNGTIAKLKKAIRESGKKTLVDVITTRQAMLVREARQIQVSPPGSPLGKPLRESESGFSPSGLYGDPWVQVVVSTLNQQFNLNIQPPRPGALADAYSLPYGVDENNDRIMVGFASLSALNAATQYGAKLLLRVSADNPYRTDEPRYRQLMFYDWNANGPDSGKWRTASWVGTPDGRATPVDPQYAGKNPGMWRSSFPGAPGYWADYEYGTLDSMANSNLIPDPSEGIVMLFVTANGAITNIRQVGKKGDRKLGQPANLLLTSAAHSVWNVLYNPANNHIPRTMFRRLVSIEMA